MYSWGCPLLAIFDAFKIWWHYLEGSTFPIDVVTDHKNLKYFSTTKILSWHQAHWPEFLSRFNMVIHFHPGHLSTKPNALTHHPDLYLKEGGKDFGKVNPYLFSLLKFFPNHSEPLSCYPLHSVASLPWMLTRRLFPLWILTKLYNLI